LTVDWNDCDGEPIGDGVSHLIKSFDGEPITELIFALQFAFHVLRTAIRLFGCCLGFAEGEVDALFCIEYVSG